MSMCMSMCMNMFVLSYITSNNRETGVNVVALGSTFQPQV